MSADQRKGISWTRIVAEGFAIVVSILLAFGIDAWWNGRQQRAAELEALRAIHQEFQTNRELLRTVEEMHSEALMASRALLALAEIPRTELPAPDSIEHLLQNARNNWTFDPLDGALNSLLNAGELGLVSSLDLRVALAAWPDLVQELNEDEVIQRNEIQERFTPYLGERIPLRGLFRAEEGPAASQTDYAELIRGIQFMNLLEVRRRIAQNILGELRSVHRTLDEIINLIEQEVG